MLGVLHEAVRVLHEAVRAQAALEYCRCPAPRERAQSRRAYEERVVHGSWIGLSPE